MKSLRILRNILVLALSLAGSAWAQRAVSVVVTGNQLSGAGTAAIVLASQGDENALGFSVTFNPAVLRYDGFTAGADVVGATVNANESQKTSGKIGFAIAVAAGSRFVPGARQLVVLKFTVLAAASDTIGFGDAPIRREVADVTARELPASYQPLTIATRRGN
jgi:hypothetical protein